MNTKFLSDWKNIGALTPIIIWIIWMYIDQVVFLEQRGMYLYESWVEPLFLGLILLSHYLLSRDVLRLKLSLVAIFSGFLLTIVFGLPWIGLPGWVFKFPTILGYASGLAFGFFLILYPYMKDFKFTFFEKVAIGLFCISLIIIGGVASYRGEIFKVVDGRHIWCDIGNWNIVLILLVFFVFMAIHSYPFKKLKYWIIFGFLLFWFILGILVPPHHYNLKIWQNIFRPLGKTYLFARDRGILLLWIVVCYSGFTYLSKIKEVEPETKKPIKRKYKIMGAIVLLLVLISIGAVFFIKQPTHPSTLGEMDYMLGSQSLTEAIVDKNWDVVESDFIKMREAGIEWIRVPILWAFIEPEDDRYDWFMSFLIYFHPSFP
ncbi:MAG: hypothetical protein QMD12_02385 [Candidatus Aenigmarchaeota archaeon]|nr:hypothetical protein [Candidatus Aenigmarchaeota archaeon]